MTPIQVVQIGLGSLGLGIAQNLFERRAAFRLVGAVDVDDRKIGRDVGDLAGLPVAMRVPVRGSLEEVLRRAKPDLAILATVSDLRRIAPQVEAIVAHRIPVVTTCEELSFPWKRAPRLAKRIDRAARAKRVAVLATGVNPGFLMDLLPLTLTAVCRRVDRVRVSRIQDAAFRREPFQKKIGAGLTLEEFAQKQATGELRHVGLAESAHMIAERLGWRLSRTEEILSPVVARKTVHTPHLTLRRGMIAGVEQLGRGFVAGTERITLLFRASIGEPRPEDTVEILGEPRLVFTIPGGVNGDAATCAIVLNAARQVLHAPPGLRTMADIPPVSWFSG
ncbi:MAG: dihydrodipicolinate reductase [Planctomycetota bacterium]